MNKANLITLTIILAFLATATAVTADVVTIEVGTQFTPDLSNITYTALTRFTCDELSVDLFCLNITGGDYAGKYCDKSATPLNYTIEGAHFDSTMFDQNRCYGLIGGFISTSKLLPVIVIVLIMAIILPIIYVLRSGSQDQVMDFVSSQGNSFMPLVVGVGVMAVIIVLVLAFTASIVSQGCVP